MGIFSFQIQTSSPKSNFILLNMIFILESTIKRTIVISNIFYFICIQKEKNFLSKCDMVFLALNLVRYQECFGP